MVNTGQPSMTRTFTAELISNPASINQWPFKWISPTGIGLHVPADKNGKSYELLIAVDEI